MKSMILKLLFFPVLVPEHAQSAASNNPISYIIGGIIALLILGYLVYSLLRPEKF
jgi:K+-transporting ATPase KdpF subunit